MIQEIKSLIRNNASDEDLITAVTKASVNEKERNLVQDKHHKKTSNRSGQVGKDNKVLPSETSDNQILPSDIAISTYNQISSSATCGTNVTISMYIKILHDS